MRENTRKEDPICVSVKLAALLAAAALSVGMLTACSKSDASSMMPSPTPMSQATDEAADTPETAPATATPEDADMGYTEAGLTRVLGGFVTYEAGSAGGSLKAAIAAADVVRYTAQYGKGHEEEIRTDAMNWKTAWTPTSRRCWKKTGRTSATPPKASPRTRKDQGDAGRRRCDGGFLRCGSGDGSLLCGCAG